MTIQKETNSIRGIAQLVNLIKQNTNIDCRGCEDFEDFMTKVYFYILDLETDIRDWETKVDELEDQLLELERKLENESY